MHRCVSELVSNAVLHGRPAITLEVSTEPPGIGIIVAVTDLGPDLPVTGANRPDSTNPHGRGLLIVAALADAWGIGRNVATGSDESSTDTSEEIGDGDPHPGKTIWFELH